MILEQEAEEERLRIEKEKEEERIRKEEEERQRRLEVERLERDIEDRRRGKLFKKELSDFFDGLEKKLALRAEEAEKLRLEAERQEFEDAAKLLEDSSLSVAEISKQTGYASVKGFYHSFKKRFQMLPTEYRERHSKKSH